MSGWTAHMRRAQVGGPVFTTPQGSPVVPSVGPTTVATAPPATPTTATPAGPVATAPAEGEGSTLRLGTETIVAAALGVLAGTLIAKMM